ncbi:MAG: RNA-directed DNA polymerase [Nitrosomonas sp.]|nr:RNA-directed DNA polymerase [Nitrosomonas sp.]
MNVEEFLNSTNEWHFSTKEKLSPDDLIDGLLDFGLFPEKVPPCFTSRGLAKAAKDLLANCISDNDESSLKKMIEKYSSDYIRYEALRDINVPRHLGIPHPAAYAIQVLGIARYWEEISRHCNKPQPQFSRIHVRHTGNGRVFEMNYKGNERYKIEEIELEWMAGAKYLVKADIASCFPSIYTHSIPWALHGKDQAKESNKRAGLAGNFLDKVTQSIRDKQTNGLLIGPHSSNVISEIVLTSIDVNLQEKGYSRVSRHIDDYTFYALSHEEAERFVKDLGMCLRAFEMSINDKKTQILELPRASTENWIHRLSTFTFPDSAEVKFSTIRSYLDLALDCAHAIGKSTPLNYAIKTLSGKNGERKLNGRAKRMYTQEAINLALAYPYLAPLLDEFVFEKYQYPDQPAVIAKFSSSLIELGLQKLYPDAIAHAIYCALKYKITLDVTEKKLIEIISLDDCLANVILLEYAIIKDLKEVKKTLKKRAKELKSSNPREIAKNWLLAYQQWAEKDLKGNGQIFLAELKKRGIKFLVIPQKSTSAPAAAFQS